MNKGLVIKTNGEKKSIDLDFDNILKQSYKELEVEIIDIATIKVDDIFLDIIVDDMGLMKDNPKVTVSSNLRTLVGNVLILPRDLDKKGRYFRGLNENEIDTINKNIQTIIDTEQRMLREILMFREEIEKELNENKLTDKEIEILQAFKTLEFKYFARDRNNILYAYEERPSKYPKLRWFDWWHSNSRIVGVPNGKELFNFIKWEDEEPINIDNILKEVNHGL